MLAAALARIQGFLLEPAAPAVQVPVAPAAPAPVLESLDVVVTALGSRSGAGTVAAGLVSALAVPGARTGHFVHAAPPSAGAGRRLGAVTHWELPAALHDPAEVAEYGATLRRLASGSGPAAVVWHVPAAETQRAALVMAAADVVVAVADGAAEPALCSLVCDLLRERCRRVVLAANRVDDPERWSRWAVAAIPESRLGALLLSRGHGPGGVMEAAFARLGACVEGE